MWRRAPPRRCTAAPTGSSTSTRRRASAARPASPPARTTRSSSTPTTTRRRSATSARTGSTSGSSRRASSCARSRRSSSATSTIPAREVAEIVNREPVTVRRPEKETRPQALLPGRAPGDARPAGGAPPGGRAVHVERAVRRARRRHGRAAGAAQHVRGGRALLRRAASATVGLAGEPLHVDEGHRGRRLPRRAARLRSPARWPGATTLWRWAAPLLAGVFLALTGAVLIWDLEHPRRFLYIFTRPQWRSWLVRGAYVIAGYSVVLAAHLAASLAGLDVPQRWLAVAGLPLAAMTAAYTALPVRAGQGARPLAETRCWLPHLLVQAALAGAAALLPIAAALGSPTTELEWVLGAAALAHLVIVGAEASTGARHRTRRGGRVRDDARTLRALVLGRRWRSSRSRSPRRGWAWRPRRSRCSGCWPTSMPTSRPGRRCRWHE